MVLPAPETGPCDGREPQIPRQSSTRACSPGALGLLRARTGSRAASDRSGVALPVSDTACRSVARLRRIAGPPQSGPVKPGQPVV
jgi:hypothetical protein